MEEMVILVVHGGAHMCKWPALATMLKKQAEELRAVGLKSSPSLVSTTLDSPLVLQQRAWRLLKEGLIQHGEAFWVQVIADASGIVLECHQNKWDSGGTKGVMFCVVKMCIGAY
jgi:hypothetical protein